MITINPEKLVKNVSRGGDFIFRGGLALQAEMGEQNVRRFKRFLSTGRGKTFLEKQVLLQALNPKRGTRIFNPAAPLIAKRLSQEFTAFKSPRHIDIGDGSFSDIAKRGLIGQTNAVRFFGKNKGEHIDLQVRYGGDKISEKVFKNFSGLNLVGLSAVKDFIKFRIRDMVNGKWIIFPALLDGGVTDNSSTSPSSTSYLGRADKVYIYGDYTRTISFSIDVVAQREEDIPIIWEKINYVKGLVLPQYKEFGEIKGNRPVPPIVKLTLGDLFNDTPGLFTSINLTIPANSSWELEDGQQVPHLAKLAFEFTYIGKQNPTMTSAHFDNIGKKFKMGDPNDKDVVVESNQKRETEEIARTAEISKNLIAGKVNLDITGNERNTGIGNRTPGVGTNRFLNVVPTTLRRNT